MKSVSGDAAETRYSFDLSAYAGKKVEIRFTFSSDAGVNASGVAVDNLELK
jgi:bacillopeptidase F (M6 metalloprotease family)